MMNKDLIVVTDTKSNSEPTPNLHALEIYPTPKTGSSTSVTYLRESPERAEAYVMLPGEVIPFQDYIDIQADFLSLAFFKVRNKLQELSQRKEYINYVIDVSGPSKASKEKLFYSTRTPEDIRGTTYGYISFDDFLSLYMNQDFNYGLLLEIDEYETDKMKDSRFFFQVLPWPVLSISVEDEKMSLLLKLTDLEKKPTPSKILELITYYYKRLSLVLGMFDLESFRLILVNLDERDKIHELIWA